MLALLAKRVAELIIEEMGRGDIKLLHIFNSEPLVENSFPE